MTETTAVIIIVALIAHAVAGLSAWVQTQRTLAALSADVHWLKQYVVLGRRQGHGTTAR